MKNLLCTLGLSVLLSAAALAQQTTPGTSDQNQANQPSTSGTQNPSMSQPQSPGTTPSDQSQGGAPASSQPGRVTGDVPTQVQQALNKQLPSSDQVTASVADDGNLKLTGTVASADDKQKAEDIARSVSNKQIDNKIEVKTGNSPETPSTPR
jgi:osmotically-inducible protein OsmY